MTGLGLVRVKCDLCKNYCDANKVRIKSKRDSTWKCSACHTKMTVCARHFGSWPPSNWGLLSEEAKVQFFNVKDAKKSSVLRSLKSLAHQKDEHEVEDGSISEFLPLSVWASRGFDVQNIETATPDDLKEEHPVLGMTYALRLHTKKDTHKQSAGTTDTIENVFGRQKLKQLKDGTYQANHDDTLVSSDETSSSVDAGDPDAVAERAAQKAKRTIAKAKATARGIAIKNKEKQAKMIAKEKKERAKQKAEEQNAATKAKVEQKAAAQEAKTLAKTENDVRKLAEKALSVIVKSLASAQNLMDAMEYPLVPDDMRSKLSEMVGEWNATKLNVMELALDPSAHATPMWLQNSKGVHTKLRPLNDHIELMNPVLIVLKKQKKQK